MSAYRHDRRVRRCGKRLEFTHAGECYAVLWSAAFGWSVWRGEEFELVSKEHPSEDEAVASILGAPQVGVSVHVDG